MSNKYSLYENLLSTYVTNGDDNSLPLLNKEISKLLRETLDDVNTPNEIANKSIKALDKFDVIALNIFNNKIAVFKGKSTAEVEFMKRHLMLSMKISKFACIASASLSDDISYISNKEYKEIIVPYLVNNFESLQFSLEQGTYYKYDCFVEAVGRFKNINLSFYTQKPIEKENLLHTLNTIIGGYLVTGKDFPVTHIFSGKKTNNDLAEFIILNINEKNSDLSFLNDAVKIDYYYQYKFDNGLTVNLTENSNGGLPLFNMTCEFDGKTLNSGEANEYEIEKNYNRDIPPASLSLTPFTTASVLRSLKNESFGVTLSTNSNLDVSDIETFNFECKPFIQTYDNGKGVKIVKDSNEYKCFTFEKENPTVLFNQTTCNSLKEVVNYINTVINMFSKVTKTNIRSIFDKDFVKEDLQNFEDARIGEIDFTLTGKTPHEITVRVKSVKGGYDITLGEIGQKMTVGNKETVTHEKGSHEFSKWYPKLSKFLKDNQIELPSNNIEEIVNVLNFIKNNDIGTSNIILSNIIEDNKDKLIKFFYTNDDIISTEDFENDINKIKEDKTPIYYFFVQSNAANQDDFILDHTTNIMMIDFDTESKKLFRQFYKLNSETSEFILKTHANGLLGNPTTEETKYYSDDAIGHSELLDKINKSIKFIQKTRPSKLSR